MRFVLCSVVRLGHRFSSISGVLRRPVYRQFACFLVDRSPEELWFDFKYKASFLFPSSLFPRGLNLICNLCSFCFQRIYIYKEQDQRYKTWICARRTKKWNVCLYCLKTKEIIPTTLLHRHRDTYKDRDTDTDTDTYTEKDTDIDTDINLYRYRHVHKHGNRDTGTGTDKLYWHFTLYWTLPKLL